MNLAAGLCLIKTSFINMLAYRVNYFTGILTYTVHIAVNSAILVAMQKGASGNINFNAQELITFTAIGYFLRSCTFNNLDQDIAGQVNDGSLVMDLIKPLDYPMAQIYRGIGAAGFRLFCFSAPIVLVNCGLFSVMGPQGPLWAVVISACLAFWIFAQITLMIGFCAVHMTSINGLIRLKQLGLNLLMGLLIPISLFPQFLQDFLDYTPFPQVSWIPVMIYMGRFDELGVSGPWHALSIQLFWAIAMTLCARLAWSRIHKHITVQGG